MVVSGFHRTTGKGKRSGKVLLKPVVVTFANVSLLKDSPIAKPRFKGKRSVLKALNGKKHKIS